METTVRERSDVSSIDAGGAEYSGTRNDTRCAAAEPRGRRHGGDQAGCASGSFLNVPSCAQMRPPSPVT